MQNFHGKHIKPASVEEAICETQGEIYACVAKLLYPMKEFSELYMHSAFCKNRMDVLYSPFQMADAEECLDFILPEIKLAKGNAPSHSENVVYWIGYTYRQLAFYLGISSVEIVSKLPFDAMLIYYPGLHTVAEEMSIEIITEDKFAYLGC